MKLLVISDSHGARDNLARFALLAHRLHADTVIHLGDHADDLSPQALPCPLITVRGNCDWGSSTPVTGEYTALGVKIFFTHGHLYGVKSGEYNIVCAARERKAQVLLYGHTHNAFTDYEDGLYLMNPGSLSGWQATYGTLDLTEQGIVTNVVTLP